MPYLLALFVLGVLVLIDYTSYERGYKEGVRITYIRFGKYE